MSTRGMIAIEDPDGTCRAIYCHFDMYPERAGSVLRECYADAKPVEELLKLGDLSELNETPETCKAYCRDYGEALNEPTVWASRDQYGDKSFDSHWVEYLYLFVPAENTWYCHKGGKNEWRRVDEVLEERTRRRSQREEQHMTKHDPDKTIAGEVVSVGVTITSKSEYFYHADLKCEQCETVHRVNLTDKQYENAKEAMLIHKPFDCGYYPTLSEAFATPEGLM